MLVARAWGWGKWRDVGQSVQVSSYRMNKIWGSNLQHGEYGEQYYIIHLKGAKRLIFNVLSTKNKWQLCKAHGCVDVLTNPTVVIILK